MTKKDEILIKAARIVNDEGIQKLTMSYLAEKAELTKGGVLYHFDSKEDILLNMNKKVIQEFDDRIDTHIRKLSGPYRYSRAYALATLDYINDSENILYLQSLSLHMKTVRVKHYGKRHPIFGISHSKTIKVIQTKFLNSE